MLSNDEVLDFFWEKGRTFLNTRYAIMGGAMSWISEHNLVSAISNAGGFGVIAGGAMPPEILKEEIAKTAALTKNSFGVNLITMHPQLDELIDTVREDRMLSRNNPSAQLNYHIPEMLKEIIASRFYESDYRNVTQKLLYENISYDYAVENGIAVVSESDVFLYKKNRLIKNV